MPGEPFPPRARRTIFEFCSVRRRVFLLDDHPLVREWLAGLVALEPDLEVCGQAEEASVALGAVLSVRPNIVVVDLSLPRGSGLEFIKDVRAQQPSTRLLVLSMHDEASVAERAFRAGAHGYVVKRESGPQIIEAIRAVLAGKFHASPALTAELAGRMLGSRDGRDGQPEDLLSDRELDVFRLRGHGRSTKEIAHQLRVSAKTISCYEVRIREKLGLPDAGELMRKAVLWHDQHRGF
jgi:DNA-binding NarL/FixJ family response regulator